MDKASQQSLDTQLAYVAEQSPFYKRKWEGLTPSAKDLASLPFTEKEELLEDQADYPPYGTNLCVTQEKVQRVQKTSGSSNRPVMIAMTASDIDHTTRVGADCFKTAGLTSSDTVVHCLNYCLWMGGCTDHQSLERTGATVVPYGVGNSAALIELMLRLKPTALHCTPSYLAKLEQVMLEQFPGTTPKDLGLRIGLLAGEGGLQDPNFRGRIEDTWGLRAMNSNYGVSEVLSMIAAECQERQGLHFMADGVLLPELIEPVAASPLPLETGTQGELVLTNLCREAQPLVRYRTHDIIRIIDHERCTCGRDSFRFEVQGRSDDMLIIKGINLFPSTIGTVINGMPELAGEYRVHVSSQEPLTYLRIVAECNTGDRAALSAELAARIKRETQLLPDVTLVDANSLPRTAGKTKRVIRD